MKTFFQTLVILTLVYVLFTSITITFGKENANYRACAIALIVLFVSTLVVGSSFMFYSMERKHDMQALMMVQYVFGLLVGHEEVRFVISATMEILDKVWSQVPAEKHSIVVIGLTLLFFWFQSVYALGATFFRTNKYNWIPTTAIIIVLVLLMVWITPDKGKIELVKDDTTSDMVMNGVYVVWVALNFWLSYRLFCRRQVIGRFINL